MNKEYFFYSVCATLALKAVILPDWPTTVAFIFCDALIAFFMWIDFKSTDDKSDKEIDDLKSEIKTVSDRLSSLSLKVGIKR